MTTLPTTVPTVGDDVTPTFTAATTTDKFTATGGKYILYYKVGASGVITTVYALNTAPAPAGTVPAAGAGATNWADLRLSNGIAVSTDGVCIIPDVAPYIDATGFVNIKLVGTVTTVTVAVVGPL